MGKFRRFCLIFYVLASACGIALLVAPWMGPWRAQASAAAGWVPNEGLARPLVWSYVYWGALAVCGAAAAIGLLATLIRAITTPGKHKVVQLQDTGAGVITLSCDAIASQARYVVEEEGSCEVVRASARAKGRDRVSVDVQVRPYGAANVAPLGNKLYELLHERLSEFTGGALADLEIHFLPSREPRAVPAQDVISYVPSNTDYALEHTSASASDPAPVAEEVSEAEPEPEEAPASEAPVEFVLTGDALHNEGRAE